MNQISFSGKDYSILKKKLKENLNINFDILLNPKIFQQKAEYLKI